MIEAVKGSGNTCLALCKCDTCAAEVVFNAMHDNQRGGIRSAKARTLTLREPGMVNRSLVDRGWVVGRTLRCPACEAKRKAAAASLQSKVSDLQKSIGIIKAAVGPKAARA